ncbi:hypothetical protein [Streptomyces boluensis]|nr:hypothetical protein [Streptomyces boluensis]
MTVVEGPQELLVVESPGPTGYFGSGGPVERFAPPDLAGYAVFG